MRAKLFVAILSLGLFPARAAAQHVRRGFGFFPGRGLAPSLGFGHINHPGLGFAPNTPGIGFPLRGPVGTGLWPVRQAGGLSLPFGVGYGWFSSPIFATDVVPTAQQPTVIVIQAAPAPNSQPVQPDQLRPAPANKKVELTYEVRPRREEKQPHPLTLLVFKDHTLRAATRCWKEGDRLRYVTSQGMQHSVNLDSLDLDFTRKLNRDRNIPFDF